MLGICLKCHQEPIKFFCSFLNETNLDNAQWVTQIKNQCHNFYFPFVPLTHVALILEVAS